MKVDIEGPAAAARIPADEARVVSFVDRRLEPNCLVVELTPDVDVGDMSAHREPGEQAALDQLVWIVAHHVPVLTGAGLALVGVDDEIMWAVGALLLRHERPLQAGREAGAAAPAELRGLDLIRDPVVPPGHQRRGAVPIPAHAGTGEPPVADAVEVGEDPIGVGKHLQGPVKVVSPEAGAEV